MTGYVIGWTFGLIAAPYLADASQRYERWLARKLHL